MPAGFERGRLFNRERCVFGVVPLNTGDICTIDENFGVFVVIYAELQVIVIPNGNHDFPAEPNIGSVPRRIDMGPGSTGGAETTFAIFPRGVVEFDLIPFLGALGRVFPRRSTRAEQLQTFGMAAELASTVH